MRAYYVISAALSLMILLQANAQASTTPVEVVNIKLNQADEYELKIGKSGTFCHEPSKFLVMFQNPMQLLFKDLYIELISVDGIGFKPFSVRGVSTDDAHSHMERSIFWLFDIAERRESKPKAIKTTSKRSYLRDLLSSCPGSIFNLNNNICSMRFSPSGTACVTISGDKKNDHRFVVEVYEKYNARYLVLFNVGIALLFYTNLIAKSKFFQYFAGSFIGVVCGGSFIMLWLILRLLGIDRLTKEAAEYIAPFLLLLSFISGAAFAVSYELHKNVAVDWQWTALYMLISSFAGMLFVRRIRGDEDSKHSLMVTVKWVLRSIAIAIIYNSFSSPLHSLLSMVVMFIVYILYSFQKAIRIFFSRFGKKSHVNKKTKNERKERVN